MEYRLAWRTRSSRVGLVALMDYKWNRERLIEYAKSLDFEVLDGIPEKGESYIAGRNTEPKLLTCESVSENGWVQPKEFEYSYD